VLSHTNLYPSTCDASWDATMGTIDDAVTGFQTTRAHR
jgi:hypothetical protein